MDDILLQLGVGGIFAILVIREVLPFLTKNKKFLPDGMESRIYEIIAQLTSHMKDQSKGIDRVAEELRDINHTLGQMSSDYHFIREKMESVEQSLDRAFDRRSKIRGNGN